MRNIVAALMLLLPACGVPCFPNSASNTTNYSIQPDVATPKGVAVDTSGFYIDLETADAIVDALETCLATAIPRECLTVKIAPDWYISPCSGSEVFPCDIPQTLCPDAPPQLPLQMRRHGAGQHDCRDDSQPSVSGP